MKYLSILLLSLFLFSCNLGKTVVFQTDKFSFREKIDDQWTEFSTWQPTNAQVKINKKIFKKHTMTVYDLDTIQYKVIGSVKETKTDGGQEVLFFNCEASDGSKCHLMFINQDTTVSFIIYYSNFNMCYNIKDLK